MLNRPTLLIGHMARPGHRSSLVKSLGCLAFLASAMPATASEVGVWIDDTGKGAVEIKPCGKKLCGQIVWLKEPNNARGEPLTDGYNPNAAKRKRPICGLPVLGDLQRQSGGGWGSGWVYDPKKGQSYDAAIELTSRDRLTVTGYWGIFSKSFVWTRAKSELPRCSNEQIRSDSGRDARKPAPG